MNQVSFAYGDEPHQMDYDVVDMKLVEKIVEEIC